MLSINTAGIVAKLRLVRVKKEQSITRRYRNFVEKIFVDIVQHTPQWSGNLAQNWSIEVGSAWQGEGRGSYSDIRSGDWWDQDPIYQKGSQPAVGIAKLNIQNSLDNIRWNSKVRIVNYADYADEVEAGIGPDGRAIRPVNLTSPYGVAMAEYAKLKYGKLGYLNGSL